jgi:hypothetical protein
MSAHGRFALALAALVALSGMPARADAPLTEDFAMQPDTRWRFFTDGVMGGVSTGKLAFVEEDGRTHARMTGQVSTANRGGFIQMRMALEAAPPKDATGVRLVMRGNGQRYFVHLRTSGTVLPWQFYQASFDAPEEWTEIQIPFSAFRASGGFLRTPPRPESLTSIAIAAYGRDHEAEIELRDIGFY